MVYNTQNYWVFGLCPLSGILKIREHNVSETLIGINQTTRRYIPEYSLSCESRISYNVLKLRNMRTGESYIWRTGEE
jgi:hypothetical protein